MLLRNREVYGFTVYFFYAIQNFRFLPINAPHIQPYSGETRLAGRELTKRKVNKVRKNKKEMEDYEEQQSDQRS